MKRLMIAAFALGLLVSGCDKKESEKPPEPAKKAEKQPKRPEREIKLPSLSPAAPATKVEGAATSADFEEEADKSVHFENLEAELDRLEAEIAGS